MRKICRFTLGDKMAAAAERPMIWSDYVRLILVQRGFNPRKTRLVYQSAVHSEEIYEETE